MRTDHEHTARSNHAEHPTTSERQPGRSSGPHEERRHHEKDPEISSGWRHQDALIAAPKHWRDVEGKAS